MKTAYAYLQKVSVIENFRQMLQVSKTQRLRLYRTIYIEIKCAYEGKQMTKYSANQILQLT